MSNSASVSGSMRWIVDLKVVDDDGVRYIYTVDCDITPETATDAIDFALMTCDEKVVGLERVRREDS